MVIEQFDKLTVAPVEMTSVYQILYASGYSAPS